MRWFRVNQTGGKMANGQWQITAFFRFAFSAIRHLPLFQCEGGLEMQK
jgi:hypothetical protein